MTGTRHTDEDALKRLREIKVQLATGHDVSEACQKAGISDVTFKSWRRKFVGMGRSQLSEMRGLEIEARARQWSERHAETTRGRRHRAVSVAEFELGKPTLKESFDFLKQAVSSVLRLGQILRFL